MRYIAGNTPVICPCCKHTQFDKDYRQLNSRGATFFGLDWANKEAAILVCQNCSFIMWFMESRGEPVTHEGDQPYLCRLESSRFLTLPGSLAASERQSSSRC